MGAVIAGVLIGERREAWKLALRHFGQAITSQEDGYSMRKLGHLQAVNGMKASPAECGAFVASLPCEVKTTTTLTVINRDIKFGCTAVHIVLHIVLHISGSK
jgi:hypothetical protein